MFWDKKTAGQSQPSKSTARQRGSEAGCVRSGGNRCSVKKTGIAGQECDEFPFKSVEPVAKFEPFNRCVPKEQNKRMSTAPVFVVVQWFLLGWC